MISKRHLGGIMNRTPLAMRSLPDYSRGEEIMNMVTHIVGGGVGIITLVVCILRSVYDFNGWSLAGSIVFGCSMVSLYTMSSVYHGLSPRLTAKKVFQILDHCTIFVLIAGTYTPILLCSVRRTSPILCFAMLILLWGVAALGITLNAIDIKRYGVFSMVCYLTMGWCVVLTGKTAVDSLGIHAFGLILLGGILYTVGAVFYGLARKTRYMHSVFHIFVCLASVAHSAAVFLYVI